MIRVDPDCGCCGGEEEEEEGGFLRERLCELEPEEATVRPGLLSRSEKVEIRVHSLCNGGNCSVIQW